MKTVHALGAVALAAMLGVPATAAVVVTIENPGVSNTTQTGFSELGVETFDNRATGVNQSFTSDFGGTSYEGDYTGVQVWDNGSWGGVDNTNYAVALGANTRSSSTNRPIISAITSWRFPAATTTSNSGTATAWWRRSATETSCRT